MISLPRDSWVDIPGHGMNKINAAFGLGGPALMVATVAAATGLTINDFIEVNFLGFVKVIDALGGVNICLPYAVNDPYSGLTPGRRTCTTWMASPRWNTPGTGIPSPPPTWPGSTTSSAALLAAEGGHQLRHADRPDCACARFLPRPRSA